MSTPAGHGLLGALEEQRRQLRRFLVARTGSEADADDLISELWIKVSLSQPGPISNPKSYLFRMANNLVMDRARERRRRERRESEWTADQLGAKPETAELADSAPTAEQNLLERDEAQRLRAAIARLPSGAQRVLRMHKFEGLSHAEVAARLGISKSAVEKHMAVAMTHLRHMLAAEGEPHRRRLSGNKGGPTVVGTGSES